MSIRKTENNDLNWIKDFFNENWGSDFIVSRGKIHKADELDGYIYEQEGKNVGLVTFKTNKDEMEIISLNSSLERNGTGTTLLNELIGEAKKRKLKKIWLITTNDNLNALKFYQKREFHLTKVHPNSVETLRKLKPQIPEIGEHGIPLRDEIELEMNL